MERHYGTSEDPTEDCTQDTWDACQQTQCRWHGTCHTEAMMQPPPDELAEIEAGLAADADHDQRNDEAAAKWQAEADLLAETTYPEPLHTYEAGQ
ncbi:hypothetical protein LCGC14_2610770 [marine sediment metagenome]|uniref:Uncharacterized protein n=1 Tax=marine sediment metagenome TaxID=412755 RepID=A0A0F9A668_9ZZZZ